MPRRLSAGTYQALFRQEMFPCIYVTYPDYKQALQQDGALTHAAKSLAETCALANCGFAAVFVAPKLAGLRQ